MRIYVAGPMTGIADRNYPAFADAASFVRSLGHEAVSPAEINDGLEDEGWSACMRRDVVQLAGCDAVLMLPGYEHSRGALLEQQIADALGMRVFFARHNVPCAEAESSNAHSERLLAAHRRQAAADFQRETDGA
jgi:hypothetical protein